jgi:sulfoxide reductase catalytic subunit YedY
MKSAAMWGTNPLAEWMVAMHTVIVADLGFPVWLRVQHLINLIFMGLLIRSGIQILASYPRLYWNRSTRPGSEWLKFTRKPIPKDRLWITLEQEQPVTSWLAQPGGDNLGLGRHWHFFAVFFWGLNGVVYVILLFATGEWRRLIPTSWSIVPDAWHTFVGYITFHLPPASAFHPYDPLQQLAYAGVVFILGPFLIITGAGQSPAIEAQFPRFSRLLGGRQSARSLHFLGLLAFVAFIIVHVALVIITGFGANMDKIVLGQDRGSENLAVGIGLGVLAAVFICYGLSSWWSRRHPRQAQHALGGVDRLIMLPLTHITKSHQDYAPKDISPVFLVNGMPPKSDEFERLRANDYVDYHLTIEGLVEHPMQLSLTQLYAMDSQEQITQHNCIQGWSGIAKWKGVPLTYILNRCEPQPAAKYAVFHSYSEDTEGHEFYEVLDLDLLRHPQTILAYEMNDRPLPYEHGAPVRLRVETQLGFKMVKWVRSIEFVADYRRIREGQGGSREDEKYYERVAGI